MKNIALTQSIFRTLSVVILLVTLGACSSGATVADVPPVITGFYEGGYENLNRDDRGTMRLNLAQDTTADTITGTLQIAFDPTNESCLASGTVTGSVNGFSVNLVAEFTSERGGGTITFQLTANDNTLIGTYVPGGDACSNGSGSGNVNLSR